MQLIEAAEGAHLWADRFDRDLADIFLLQDEVVGEIVGALSDALPSARPVVRQRARNLEAYDLFVRGRVMVTQSIESNREARLLLQKSIDLDPSFADAHAWLAMSHHCGWSYWGESREPHRTLAVAAAQSAVSLDPNNPGAHAILGDILVFDRKYDEGAAEMALALKADPNHADAWAFYGCHTAYSGNPVGGIDQVRHALRLNPHPPGWYYWHLGLLQFAAGLYAEATETLSHEATHRLGSQRILAAALAMLGRLDQARLEANQFLTGNPGFSAREWVDRMPFRNDLEGQRFMEGYMKAGLPP